ncbi:MAG: ABC transporter permease [Ardenticatenaceae bacterium]|nr:ABC transporter permease [Anaerolineales bacterium]MCB8919869.1 ABC transporter permease [Ardenticatenaceae bacterium]
MATETQQFVSKDWTILKNRPGWQALNLRELWQYRDLLYFLVWRDIKSRYAQSVLGVGWAIIQPVFNMLVFTIIFGNLASVSSDGVPYAIFNFAALVPWTYFANALSGAATSLVTSSSMISKVYFPRLLIPLAPALGKLVDFAIAMAILLLLVVWFQVTPNLNVLALPLLVLIMVLAASGAGMWLTALSIQYRDISYALSFIIQMLMYASPVVYPASSVPAQFRLLYGINPMVGVIEGFRSAFLSTNPMPWDLILVAGLSALFLSVSGAFYFRRMERIFADVA